MRVAEIIAESPTQLTLLSQTENRRIREQLVIGGGYPRTTLAEEIFLSAGIGQLIGPFLPEVIKADVAVLELFHLLINEMYIANGLDKPEWEVTRFDKGTRNLAPADNNSVEVTYSGGKDSLWNLWEAIRLGLSPHAVHIAGLNQSVAKAELEGVLRQQGAIGFPLTVVELKNSRSSRGYSAMNWRDFFLAAVSIPTALEHRAGQIFLEGGYYQEGEANGKSFSYHDSAWKTYNRELKKMGIPVEMVGTDRSEINSIKDLLMSRPEWLSLVSNCFSMPVFRPGIRQGFQKNAPSFALYEGQCGSCMKCNTVNLVRLKYDPAIIKGATREDKQKVLVRTRSWLKRKRGEVADIIDPGFEALLSELEAELI